MPKDESGWLPNHFVPFLSEALGEVSTQSKNPSEATLLHRKAGTQSFLSKGGLASSPSTNVVKAQSGPEGKAPCRTATLRCIDAKMSSGKQKPITSWFVRICNL